MLLYVVDSNGSSPGRVGFGMSVNSNAEMCGSIGGGIMEHKFVELAKEKLKENPGFPQIRRQLHEAGAVKDRSGMICSGEQTILLYHVKNEDLHEINKLLRSLNRNENGTLEISPSRIRFKQNEKSSETGFQFTSESEWLYREKTGHLVFAHIIGGGHCSLALSGLLRSLDFYVRVYDERTGLKTMEENTSAHEKLVVSGFSELRDVIEGGKNNYAIIMTFGYRTDDIALRALLGKGFEFLGVLGSRSKIDTMFSTYRQEGISEEVLSSIYSPVGLSINSQTPVEIAVSIAAQIIKVKNERK